MLIVSTTSLTEEIMTKWSELDRNLEVARTRGDGAFSTPFLSAMKLKRNNDVYIVPLVDAQKYWNTAAPSSHGKTSMVLRL